jgi:hypothetical protein
MYVKRKMRYVEAIPGIGEGELKGMIYCKNFCKCHNVPSGQQHNNKYKIIKKREE